MIMSVSFYLSYDLFNVISSPLMFVYFNENLHCWQGPHYDVTFFRGKCYVICGHDISYDMTLSIE